MAITKSVGGFLNKKIIVEHLNSIVDNEITSWDQLPSYNEFLNMDKGIELFTKTVQNGNKIVFVHDSDVDGIGTYCVSYGVLSHLLLPNYEIKITDRSQGYGFQPLHLNGLKEGDLIITADNGITSNIACREARKIGVNVIVTDHHLVDKYEGLPDAIIIDPHQKGCNFPYKHINGTMVYWYFMRAITDYYKTDINMIDYFLPELMLTTISDVMPLTGINRFIVKTGLKYIKDTRNNGWTNKQWLNTFVQNCKSWDITSEALAFGFIPALNAAARMAKAEYTAYYMIETDMVKSREWFDYLNAINNQRKQLQYDLKQYILDNYGSWMAQDFILIPGANDNKLFSKGILGPTAGNLAEQFNKPTIVLKANNEGVYSGSGRSVGDVDMLGIIKENPFTIQEKTGGHKAACGVALESNNLNDFFLKLQEETKKVDRSLFKNNTHVLGKLELSEINWDLYQSIRQFEPFGQGFKRPQFLIKANVASMTKTKDGKHMFLQLDDGLGSTIKANWFNYNQEIKRGKQLTFCCTIQHDDFKEPNKQNLVLFIRSIGEFLDWDN